MPHPYHAGTATLLAALLLSGCATLQSMQAVDRKVDTIDTGLVRPTQEDFRRRVNATQRARDQHVDRPWIVGKPQPLGRDVTLPAPLRANVRTTMLFADGPADLVQLADRIYQASGIPVRIEPDALMPAAAFLPRLSTENPELTTPPPTQADTLLPAIQAPLPGDARTQGPAQRSGPPHPARIQASMLPQGQAPLPMVLDAIALRLGVSWRYDAPTASIVVFRTESRTFSIRALAEAAETNLSLGLTGTAEAGNSFASSNHTRYAAKSEHSPMMAVVHKIEHLLTRAGSIRAPEGGTNSIVVTDTPEALARIARFLDAENKILTRRVRLVFEEVTLEQDDTGQAGLDWNVLFTSGGRGVSAAASGPGMLLDSARLAGSIGASLGSGQWTGSSISIGALSEIGTILRHTTLPLLSINRRPATYAVRETFPYIKDLQQTQSTSDSASPTVTVTQEEETVGTFLTVIPDAQTDGQVLLTLGYDTKRLVDLKKMAFGANNTSFVQQPYINGQGSTQQVIVQSGQRVLVAGFDQSDDNYKHRRLDRNAPILFGGSDAVQQKRVVTLLFVTAIAEEGA